MKKLLSIVLLCAMLASLLASCAGSQGLLDLDLYEKDGITANAGYESAKAWDGSASDKSWYNNNTSATVFYLEDGADLKGFIDLVYGQNVTFAGKTVQLKKDINLGNLAWEIPVSNTYFQGTFDGAGFTIGGFKMTCANGNQGLLGSIGGSAVVKDLTVIANGTISLKSTASATGAAGLVGRVYTVSGKTAKIENVAVTCTVSYNSNSKSYTYVGGIVGAVEGNGAVEITGCTNNSKVTSSKATVGGIVGGVKSTVTSVTITNCKNTGAITGEEAVGGIVGGIEAPINCTVKITGCENTGAITVNSDSTKGCAAGIVGRCRMTSGSLIVTDCKNSGSVSYTGNTTGGCWLGGILGYIYGEGSSQLGTVTVKNCHSTGKITANRTSGGLAGFFQRVDNLTVEDCSVNAEMIFNIRTEYNYYVGGLIGIIHTNNKANTAVIKNCTVSGKLTVDEPESIPSYAGGLLGAARTSTIEISDCHVDVEFKKENCEEDDVASITLGINETSNAATVNAKNVTYNFYNLLANPESYAKVQGDSTIFKPVGFQSRYNASTNTYDIRFVFGMDNLQSADKIVGFEIALKNLNVDVTVDSAITTQTPVYTSLKSGSKTYNPQDYYSEYFCTYTITGIPASEIEILNKNGTEIAVLKNRLISLTPFSMMNATSVPKKGIGITEYSAVQPDTYSFELQDFWSFLPDAFANATGVISSKNIGYITPSNVDCQEHKQISKAKDQHTLKKNCTCAGAVCTCGWGATGVTAQRDLNSTLPYQYYIDITSYKSKQAFGVELDRYAAYHTWSFEVSEDGYYEFCFRIRLNGTDGDEQTRYALVQLDDEGYASQTEFYYSIITRDGSLRDPSESYDSYLTGYGRYLTAGTHSITFRIPYDEDGVNKSSSFMIRDFYMVKGALPVDEADIPVPTGATLYNGNLDTTTCTYVLDNTSKTVFDNYRAELVKAGFVLKEEKTTEYQYSSFDVTNTPSGGNYTYNGNYKGNQVYHNYFYTYTNEDYMVHTYFCEGDKGMRVVVSEIEEYEKYVAVREENKTYKTVTTPLFALLDIGGKDITLTQGTNAGKNVTGVTNGMCLVYRLSDGRFIVFDGGYWNAADTEGEAAARLYDWLMQNADYDGDGNYKNNKVTIAAWIFTHHHSDHISIGWKFNNMYQGSKNVVIENYMYNFPDYEFSIGTPGSNLNPSYYTEWFPKMADMMKRENNLVVHTGFSYQFADMTIDILYTNEDYYPNSIKSFNNSNTVYKLTLAGKTFLVAGDLEEPGQIDAIKMTGTLLESDFLQVTHHGCNGQLEFFKYIVGLDASGNFNTDTIVIWPLPKGEDMSWFEGTSARAVAMRWLKDMFRKENDQANDNIHYAVENWVFTDFN